MPADRRQHNGGPYPCGCCGGWSEPHQRTCFGCRTHAEPCRRLMLPLQKFEASLEDLERTVVRWQLSRQRRRPAA